MHDPFKSAFRCNQATLEALWSMAELPSVRENAQRCENKRKNSFLN